MFKFLIPKPYTGLTTCNTVRHGRQKTILATSVLIGVLSLSACQQQAVPESSENSGNDSVQQEERDNKPGVKSESAKVQIAEFQPLYVNQMQGLQRRLQAEYESLQAADSADSETESIDNANDNTTPNVIANSSRPTTSSNSAKTKSDSAASPVHINTSTEVGERDLEVLKSLNLEAHKPQLLTEDEIIKRYQQAVKALYQPITTPLNAQEIDTLLNIATLTPQLFEHTQIAERLTLKSPALGRLIVQYQVWQQIEVQQALDMQKMRQSQQQEFETLMTKFDETIKGYDEQIAKYEQTLKEFQ